MLPGCKTPTTNQSASGHYQSAAVSVWLVGQTPLGALWVSRLFLCQAPTGVVKPASLSQPSKLIQHLMLDHSGNGYGSQLHRNRDIIYRLDRMQSTLSEGRKCETQPSQTGDLQNC